MALKSTLWNGGWTEFCVLGKRMGGGLFRKALKSRAGGWPGGENMGREHCHRLGPGQRGGGLIPVSDFATSNIALRICLLWFHPPSNRGKHESRQLKVPRPTTESFSRRSDLSLPCFRQQRPIAS